MNDCHCHTAAARFRCPHFTYPDCDLEESIIDKHYGLENVLEESWKQSPWYVVVPQKIALFLIVIACLPFIIAGYVKHPDRPQVLPVKNLLK